MTRVHTVPADPVGAFLGTPALLRSGAADGPLAGTTVAVKDLFDLAGLVTGAGNPTFAATHAPATRDASAVTRLVEAGADVVGKTITDELAWSLAGNNVHYGAPRNVAAPGRRTGGSSSGSAAAVTAGLVDLGLGTDTGGSIRVPASQCGLLGWRPTHGAVPMEGVVPLAPSFDTAGLLAREFTMLRRGAVALLGADTAPTTTAFAPQLIGVDEAWTVVDDRFRAGVRDLVTHDHGKVTPLGVDLAAAADAFRTLQSREAWRTHGHWIETAAPELAPDIAARFRAAATVTTDDVSRARAVAEHVAALVHAATAGAVLVLPAAPGAAPPVDQLPADADAWRAQALQLTCLAGLAGAPVVVAPLLRSDDDLPVGVAFVGAPGSDLALLDLVAALLEARPPSSPE